MRLLVAVWFFALLVGVPQAHAAAPYVEPSTDDIIATIVDRADAYGVDAYLLVRVAWCESRFDRFAVGDNGKSLGLFQLHRYGKQPVFYRYYDDIWDVWQQSDFAAWQFSIGQRHHWSCARW